MVATEKRAHLRFTGADKHFQRQRGLKTKRYKIEPCRQGRVTIGCL